MHIFTYLDTYIEVNTRMPGWTCHNRCSRCSTVSCGASGGIIIHFLSFNVTNRSLALFPLEPGTAGHIKRVFGTKQVGIFLCVKLLIQQIIVSYSLSLLNPCVEVHVEKYPVENVFQYKRNTDYWAGIGLQCPILPPVGAISLIFHLLLKNQGFRISFASPY